MDVAHELLVWVRTLGTTGIIGIAYMALKMREVVTTLGHLEKDIEKLWEKHDDLNKRMTVQERA